MAHSLAGSVSTARRTNLTGQHTFVIEQFEREMKTAKVGDRMESKPFSVGQDNTNQPTNRFAIRVYPNGYEGHVSIILWNKTDKERKVEMEIQVGDRKLKDSFTIEANRNGGWNKFLKHGEVKDHLSGGSLVVTAVVTMVGDLETVEGLVGGNTELTSRTDISQKIFQRMQNPDLVISCGGEEIPCHRIFLRAASPVFDRMLETEMKERKEGRIEIQCCPSVGKQLVKYIYTG